MTQLKNRKEEMKTEKDKSLYAQIIGGHSIFKKYKMIKESNKLVSEYLQKKFSNKDQLVTKRNTEKRLSCRLGLRKKVRLFLEQDENSAPAPGAKEAVSKDKELVRKRYYLDSTDNLYKKFCETQNVKISKSTFNRLKPFWIKRRQASDRDTCMCKEHANFQFLLERLKFLKILSTNSTTEYSKSVTCNINSKNCMYGQCNDCKDLKFLNPLENNETCWFFRWETYEVDRIGAKGLNYHVRITSKKRNECTVSELVTEMNVRAPIFLKHAYNTGHQHRAITEMRNNLEDNEVLITVDFSQNYSCKFSISCILALRSNRSLYIQELFF